MDKQQTLPSTPEKAVDMTINLNISEDEMEKRRSEENNKGVQGWKPAPRKRMVSKALKAYASMVSSADLGAVRVLQS